jgi:hypothetical protein
MLAQLFIDLSRRVALQLIDAGIKCKSLGFLFYPHRRLLGAAIQSDVDDHPARGCEVLLWRFFDTFDLVTGDGAVVAGGTPIQLKLR